MAVSKQKEVCKQKTRTRPRSDYLHYASTHAPPTSFSPSLTFYEFSYHDATMADASTLLEQSVNNVSGTHHEVFLCNCKKAKQSKANYHYPFKLCPRAIDLECSWLEPYSEQRADKNMENYKDDTHFAQADALMFSFGPSIFEHWMKLNKTLILDSWHRINLHRCTEEASQATFNRVRNLASDRAHPHIVGPQTLYDVEYVRHFTGVNPIFLPATLFDALRGEWYRSWTGSRPQFLWNAANEVPPPPALRNSRFEFVRAVWKGRYETRDLAEYQAIVYWPYSVSNGKIVEQYAMNIPMFVPTAEFAKVVYKDRTQSYDPYCPELTSDVLDKLRHHSSPYDYSPNVRIDTNGESAAEHVKFWIKFADVYHWPCIVQYSSWQHLLELLDAGADLPAMSSCMAQANKWRRHEALQNWCWVTTQLANGSG
mmetsp:Transcript_58109/g.160798  ORF Transcript_58109/g.160798 Transcript_58109/m.160798 type:complete len:426 (-) Transcript_58109:1476-2753(-)